MPASVINRLSRLSDLRDVSPDNFLKPLSLTEVKERLILSKPHKPTERHKGITQSKINRTKCLCLRSILFAHNQIHIISRIYLEYTYET